jgi:hypothetical protein
MRGKNGQTRTACRLICSDHLIIATRYAGTRLRGYPSPHHLIRGLALLLPLAGPVQAGATSAPISLAEYRASLQGARTATMGRRTAPPLMPGGAMQKLPPRVSVRMPSGVVVEVDNEPLKQALAARQYPQFIIAVDRLLAATAPPPPVFDRARANQALRDVLRRPEYQYRKPGPSLWERFGRWLSRHLPRHAPEWLRRWLRGLAFRSPGAAPRGDWVAGLLQTGVVVLLAGLVARILWLILPQLHRLRQGRGEDGGDAFLGELLVPQEPDTLLAQAEREAAAGRYREALRLAYLATVSRLDRAGALSEDRSRTHWELLRELRRAGRDPLYRVLAPVTRLLDERLYGGRQSTAADYQACRAVHDEIQRLLCVPV